jgi:glycosidase
MPLDEKLTPEQKSVKAHFSKLTDLRSRHPALRYGTRRPLLADGNRYAFVRRHFDDAVLCVWNKGSEAASYDLKVANEIPDGNYRNALNGELLRIRSGNANFSLPPRQVAFFVKAETTP